MVMLQFLYTSQENKSKTIDFNTTNDLDSFSVKDLKYLIIKNELSSINMSKLEGQLKETNIANNYEKVVRNDTDEFFDALLKNFRLILCNKELDETRLIKTLNHQHVFQFRVRLVGGKGGFGATLRSQKPKHPVTNNFDACRDLSGRRIRHVRAQQDLQNWKNERAEEDIKIEEELEEYKKHEREINAAIKRNDANKDQMVNIYKAQLELSANNITNGVILGKAKHRRDQAEMMNLPGGPVKSSLERSLDIFEKGQGDLGAGKDDFNMDDFFQPAKKIFKRVKIDENEEKEVEDEVSQEESLIIKKSEDINEPKKVEESLITKIVEPDLEKKIKPSEELPKEDIEVKKLNEESKKKALFDSFNTVSKIEDLDKLYTESQIKENLTILGLKAGGRHEERLKRLFLVKTCEGDMSKISKKLFAKKNK